ncbi:MAG: type II secretion system protein GspG [Planctomycetes bacterium]|nr:type II secretion system protein GspG [Planctomycetota bacterium]
MSAYLLHICVCGKAAEVNTDLLGRQLRCISCGRVAKFQSPEELASADESYPKKPGGNLALVVSVVGLILPFLVPIPFAAWVLGLREIRAVKAGDAPDDELDAARLARVFGFIGTITGLLCALYLFWLFAGPHILPPKALPPGSDPAGFLWMQNRYAMQQAQIATQETEVAKPNQDSIDRTKREIASLDKVVRSYIRRGDGSLPESLADAIEDYPASTTIELPTITTKYEWDGSFERAVSSEIVDPWGHPYRYMIEGDTFQITSAGPDGEFGKPDGAADDIDSANRGN